MAAEALDPAFLAGARGPRPLLGFPITASLIVHVAVLATFYFLKPAAPRRSPPVYRVDLVAAPPGPRSAGALQPQPPPATPQEAAVRPKTSPRDMPNPESKVTRAKTPDATPRLPTEAKPDTKTAPSAGGGETGGRGTDVATVSTGGIDFPYPGYLENIVRQIALRFKPSSRAALRAEVSFLIRRDGTVPLSSIQLVTRSGVFTFDLEAQGAVEAAANARAFGALPTGYPDDVLPVTFRFDPKLLR